MKSFVPAGNKERLGYDSAAYCVVVRRIVFHVLLPLAASLCAEIIDCEAWIVFRLDVNSSSKRTYSCCDGWKANVRIWSLLFQRSSGNLSRCTVSYDRMSFILMKKLQFIIHYNCPVGVDSHKTCVATNLIENINLEIKFTACFYNAGGSSKFLCSSTEPFASVTNP